MRVNGKHYRSVWMEAGVIKLINQLLIPHRFEVVTCYSYDEVADAIKTMVVRGAPAIGATGAYAMAMAINGAEPDTFREEVFRAADTLRLTRPTAKDLFTGIDHVLESLSLHDNIDLIKKTALVRAQQYADESALDCKKIGEYGNTLIEDKEIIETHCNAGWLACVDWGTALAPVYVAHSEGKEVFVYVDETRPRCQGANLTAWELGQQGVPHRVIPDNAGAYYMSKDVTMMIVGADRIAANGDVANKIGTYEKAIVAKELGIPFYVAAPTTTFDLSCASGKDIVIEQRSEEEVAYVSGWNDTGQFSRVRVIPEGSHACNPAFDVTPARYVTGIITEKGIIEAHKAAIEQLFAT